MMQQQQMPQDQNMQAFMQMLQQQGFSAQPNLIGAQPPQGSSPMQPSEHPMPPQGQPPMPQAGQSPMQPMQPQAHQPQSVMPQQMQGMSPQQLMQIQQMMAAHQGQDHQQQLQMSEQELAALGRMGDNTIAHLTKGEITVPPQVQTPKVLATLKKEYNKKGVDPSQFKVGSPQSSTNPNTGLHEYNFWSSFLPVALGGLGAAFGGPLGAGAGSSLGSMASGQKLMPSLESGALAGLGSWGLGSLVGGTGSVKDMLGLGDAASEASSSAASSNGLSMQAAQGGMSLPVAQGGGTSTPGFLDSLTPHALAQIGGAGLGSLAGGALSSAGTSSMNNPNFQSNFNNPYTPSSQLPSFAQQLGTTTYNGPQANFTGYNPATNNTQAFNFFPTASTTGVG
jgi:hypothetical protein